MIITSRSNPAVKAVRALQRRKERENTGLFFAEGIRVVASATELQAEIDRLVVAPALVDSDYARGLVSALADHGVPILEVSPDVFMSVSVRAHPQGIGAVVRGRVRRINETSPGDGLCWIALDAVADPGNLGTILRTADAVGAEGVILVGETTDPFDPAAIRASMGAVFAQRLVRAGVGELRAWAQRHGVFAAGTSDAAEKDYRSIRYPSPLLVVMGSERHGLTDEEKQICSVLVAIPMVGHSDSLNVAVAAGVMLYEVFNQRHPNAS